MVSGGFISADRRPSPRRSVRLAYLRHAEWRRIWSGTFQKLGIAAGDEFAAVAAIRELEFRLHEQLAAQDRGTTVDDDIPY
jgi:hypothetical protein